MSNNTQSSSQLANVITVTAAGAVIGAGFSSYIVLVSGEFEYQPRSKILTRIAAFSAGAAIYGASLYTCIQLMSRIM